MWYQKNNKKKNKNLTWLVKKREKLNDKNILNPF